LVGGDASSEAPAAHRDSRRYQDWTLNAAVAMPSLMPPRRDDAHTVHRAQDGRAGAALRCLDTPTRYEGDAGFLEAGDMLVDLRLIFGAGVLTENT